MTTSHPYPSLAQIRDTAARLQGKILHTPVWRWQTGVVDEQFASTEVWLKLELFQKTGTFKLRGALNCIEALDAPARQRASAAWSPSAPATMRLPSRTRHGWPDAAPGSSCRRTPARRASPPAARSAPMCC